MEAELKQKKRLKEMRLEIGTHPIGITRILLHLYPLRLHLDRRAGTQFGFLLGFAATVRVEFAERDEVLNGGFGGVVPGCFFGGEGGGGGAEDRWSGRNVADGGNRAGACERGAEGVFRVGGSRVGVGGVGCVVVFWYSLAGRGRKL